MSERQPPDKIFLQWYGELVEPFDEGVTWCEDKINYDDIEYRRAEFADTTAEIAAKYIILTSHLLEALKKFTFDYLDVPGEMKMEDDPLSDAYQAALDAIAKATAPDI